MNKRWLAYFELTAAMAIVGSSVVVGKLLIASFPVFLGAGLRFAIASAVLLPLLIRYEKGLPTYLVLKEPFVVSHLAGLVCVLLGIGLIARSPAETLDTHTA